MARPLRIDLPFALHHVTARGDRRSEIFLDDADRRAFLDLVARFTERRRVSLLAYCLMGNHFHLVAHCESPGLSAFMRDLNSSWSQRFNRRHGLCGHVFQGRFHSAVVDTDAYMTAVVRYVDLNPVRAGLVRRPWEWPWSSCRAHLGHAAPPPWLDTARVREQVLGRPVVDATDADTAARRYAAWLVSDDVRSPPLQITQGVFVGGDAFVHRVRAGVDPVRLGSAAIPKRQRAVPGTLDDWLGAGRPSPEAMRRAHVEGLFPISEIARHVGMSRSWVSRAISRLG